MNLKSTAGTYRISTVEVAAPHDLGYRFETLVFKLDSHDTVFSVRTDCPERARLHHRAARIIHLGKAPACIVDGCTAEAVEGNPFRHCDGHGL